MVSAIIPSIRKMKPLTAIVNLTAADISLTVVALLDSGSAGNFISGALCRQLQLKTSPSPTIYQINSITGKPLSHSHEWEIPEWAGLQARYEHCSFVPESDPQSLWVFAGAEKSGNRNCVQVLRMSDGLWKTVQVKGSPPTVRTYHTNSACVGDRLFVFSGGDAGAAPVTDPQVHVFDSVTATWTQPESTGKPPAPRHGHVIAAVGTDVYIHGGMSGETFHNDMFLLNTETMKWEKVKAKGEIPPGVAAHSSVSFGKNIFIFGGLTSEGASNSMYKFQCDKQRWTRLKFEGDLPPGRLDHSMCLVPWRVKTAGRETCGADVQHLCFIFGGMDTQGVIFNDCLVTLLT
ncbi:Rab9 effector protein with kelch motifs [Anabarilius grahami]|uniref:Rab9 effector protein with kelch motifs n=1 Tax=Anabarilius grahami TaxID=495550 RepID=A0A3N0Z5Y2_ANAGA|nr:Rab9 effector protein with kelch motifs [Anabarilius grahami]